MIDDDADTSTPAPGRAGQRRTPVAAVPARGTSQTASSGPQNAPDARTIPKAKRTLAVPNAERLAFLAGEVALVAPETQNGFVRDALVPWSIIHDIRAEMTAAGIDWRALVRRRIELQAPAPAASQSPTNR